MISHKNFYLQFSPSSQTIFISLVGLWSASQLMSVLGFIPEALLGILHHSKNILGATVVVWGLFIILLQIMQHRAIVFDKYLFLFALLFPFYVTLIDIVRYEISWKEVLLYWCWVTGLYLVFPAMLQGEQLRCKGIKVLIWTNLLVLLVGIFLGVLNGRYYVIEHGNRMVFGFLHPNYYSNSWQIVFAMAFYFALTGKRTLMRIANYLVMLGSIIFMLLAYSRNTLVASMILIGCYALFNKKWAFLSKFTAMLLMVSLIIIAFLVINPSAGEMDQITTGRLSIWRMTLEANLAKASAADYLLGCGNYKIRWGRDSLDKLDIDQEHFARNHVDNAYLDIFLQNGLIGFVLFFLPLALIMRRTWLHAASAADEASARQARIALGCWVGILVQMTTASVIPSFGNVINIFIFVFMAPMALKIKPVQTASVEAATSRLSPIGSIAR